MRIGICTRQGIIRTQNIRCAIFSQIDFGVINVFVRTGSCKLLLIEIGHIVRNGGSVTREEGLHGVADIRIECSFIIAQNNGHVLVVQFLAGGGVEGIQQVDIITIFGVDMHQNGQNSVV